LDGLACDLEPMAPRARHREKRKSLVQLRNVLEGLRGGSDQTKFGLAWVNSKKLTQCVAAAAGPKRREALATGARHEILDKGFYTFSS
jgi:hypothetical protein